MATPGAVLNTMLNPAAGLKLPLGGPVWKPEGFRPFNDAQIDTTLFKAMALAATYGTLTAAARWAATRYTEKTEAEKERRRILSYLRAGETSFSPDPSLADASEEKREQDAGLKVLSKKAADKPRMSAPFTPSRWATEAFDMALPALAVAGGVWGTYRIIDNAHKRKHGQELDKALAVEANKLDKENYDSIYKARLGVTPEEDARIKAEQAMAHAAGDGLAAAAALEAPASIPTMDTAPYTPITKQAEFSVSQTAADAGEGVSNTFTGFQNADRSKQGTSYAGSLMALGIAAGLAVFGTSAYLTKGYFDERDDNRKRLSALRKGLAEQQLMEDPGMLAPMYSPAVLHELNRNTQGGRAA